MGQSLHQFEDSRKVGEKVEREVLRWLARGRKCRPASLAKQYSGIDIAVETTVEVKTDTKWPGTGNAFVETVSVDTANKAGWAYTFQAHWLFYVLHPNRLLQIRRHVFQAHLNEWAARYPEASVPNRGYHSRGILVPVAELEAIAERVVPYDTVLGAPNRPPGPR